jgi:hypothetical protein
MFGVSVEHFLIFLLLLILFSNASSRRYGWSRQTIVQYNFGFRGWTASNVRNYPTFRQTLQLPSSEWICIGWAFLEALYGASSRRRVWYDRFEWRSVRTGNDQPIYTYSPWKWQLQCLPKAEVVQWTPTAKTWEQEIMAPYIDWVTYLYEAGVWRLYAIIWYDGS